MNINKTTRALAHTLGKLLLANQESVSTAESCTGGLVAGAITDIAGSSAWFNMGFVTYSNHAKVECLAIDPATLKKEGAVSKFAVKQMALNVRDIAHADWSIAVSGIAGPACPKDSIKPVGSVWFGVAGPSGLCSTLHHQLQGSRYKIRQQAVRIALNALIETIREKRGA